MADPETWHVVALYGVTIFVSAGLLFLIQPMIAKAMLPTFGGTPQVWTASMVFFQGVLLLGYSYAHVTTQRLAPRTQALVHAVVLALPLVALPIALRGTEALDGVNPAMGVLVLLALSVGLPYVVLSSTSPLLQRWFSSTDHRAAADPYFLYAASNAGSLLGLLAYPFLVEPRLAVDDQGVLWSGGYVVFAALCAVSGLAMSRKVVPNPGRAGGSGGDAAADGPPPTLVRQAGWVARAFVPTSLLLAVTTFLQTDIAAVPLLWVIPLALYLLTFILAFSPRNVLPPALAGRLLPFLVVATLATILARHSLPIWATMGIQYLTFFVAAMLAHGQLAQDRPRPAYLTRYFLLLAVGGVLGGMFNALVAPALFDDVLEYPLLLVMALLLRRTASGARGGAADGATSTTDGRVTNVAGPDGRGMTPAPVPIASGAMTFGHVTIPGRMTPSLSLPAGAANHPSGGLVVSTTGPSRWRRPATTAPDRSRVLDVVIPALVLLGVLVGLVAMRVAAIGVDGVLVLVLVAIGALVTIARPVRFALIIAGLFLVAYSAGASPMFADRTFFGVHRVVAEAGRHLYLSGATIHGAERMGPDGGTTALSYYHPTGPAGQVFQTLDHRAVPVRDVAIIGLGAGGLAAYAQADQSYTFYEIDPVVIRIASDPELFTFLSDIRSRLRVVEGDGRLRIAEEPDGSFDVLVLDAFSSDAVPAHLVTREAFELYLRKLRPGGILLANVTNSWLDVRAVVAGGAQAAGLVGRTRTDTDLSVAPTGDKEVSSWVALARSTRDLGPIADDLGWQPLDSLERTVLWTDDFSDVLSVLR